MEENWKDIEGYEGYQVSSIGRIRSLDRFVNSKNGSSRLVRGQIIKLFKSKTGYINVNLWSGQKYKSFRVHRLVAAARNIEREGLSLCGLKVGGYSELAPRTPLL